MRRAPPRKTGNQKPVFLTSGPWKGQRDSLDITSADPSLAFLIQNCYPRDSARGGGLVGRPGFQQAGAQLTGGGVGQLVYQFTKLAGTEYTIAIAGGRIFAFDWSARTWSEPVTTANLTTAAITLSPTAKCYAVTMADKMIVTDGVNTPWMWDGTAGAGGLTKLTNCPVLFGAMTVYYAKLFGIKNTERSTMVWSEENDPTIGYEAGGYNNAWQLGQADQEPLYALYGTNQSLYYFRARSTGVISGAVNTEFTTTGVHDGVSPTVGTMSPDCIVYYEWRVYFLDADFRPHVIVPGAGAKPIFGDVRETCAGLNRAYVAQAVGVYDPSTQLVLMGCVETGQTIPNIMIAMDPEQHPGQPVGVWRGFTFPAMATVKNATGVGVRMHLSSDGYAYDHGTPAGTLWSDGLAAGTVAITHIVTPSPMGADVSVEKRFDRIDLNTRSASTITGATVTTETNRGSSTAQTVPTLGISNDRHVALGLNVHGRWAKPKVTHATAGEQFGIGSLRLSAYPLNTDPSMI